jgi:hypothetical protein
VDLTIEQFIRDFDKLLIQKLFADARIHFTTQVNYIGRNSDLYTHIFNLNELYKLKELIESYTGIKLPNLHLQKSGDIQKPVLNTQQTDWIKNKYKIDYEIYGKWFA